MFRRSAQIALAFAVVVASLFTLATPAHAAKNDCPINRFCFWTSPNFTGSRYQAGNFTVGQCINMVAPFDNNSDGAYNRLTYAITIFDSYNGTGNSDEFGIGSYGPVNLALQNDTSSVCRL